MTRNQRKSGKLPAVVLTGGDQGRAAPGAVMDINALTLTRSLGRHGVPVYRFHDGLSYADLQSRYCTHVQYPRLHTDQKASAEALIEFAKSCGCKPILFPAGDLSVEFVSRWSELLDPHYALCIAARDCIETILDKERLYRKAQEIEIAVPQTHWPRSMTELVAVEPRVRFPAVLKPRSSHHWKVDDIRTAIGAVKAIEVQDAGELISAYKRIEHLAPRVMVQEIVPGDDAQLLTFLGYLGRQGQPLAGCVRKKLRQNPARFGYCCLTETVLDSEVMNSALRLLRAVSYRGIVSVEFKRDPRDGILKLIEVNARTARTTGAAIAAGVDLPYIAYLDMSGVEADPCTTYETGVRWIHVRDDLLAARELMRNGELSLREWVRIFRGRIVFAEWARDDPRPCLIAWKPLLTRAIRKVGRRLFPFAPSEPSETP